MRKNWFKKWFACLSLFFLTFLTGCNYSGKANMKIFTDGSISLETLYLVEKTDANASLLDKEYTLMRPKEFDGLKVSQVEREIDGVTYFGWYVRGRLSKKGYDAYYKSLIPEVKDSEPRETIDPLTGETIIIEPEDNGGEEIDLNDGKIHTTNIANFAPKVQVKSSGLTKSYKISYMGILDSIPEEYQSAIKKGFKIQISPCGTVLQSNATSVENGIYTWENEDINNVQIIFEYSDLWPIYNTIKIGTATILVLLAAYGVVLFWTRPSRLTGSSGIFG